MSIMFADVGLALATAATAVGWVAAFFWRAERREDRTTRGRPGFQEARFRVNGGFRPARIVLSGDHPIRLHVSRDQDGESGWDDLEFPYIRALRELPEGESVTIDAGLLEAGEYALFCGRRAKRALLVVEDRNESEALDEEEEPWTDRR